MKKYFGKLMVFAGIPVGVLIVVYLITDPFYVMKPFSLDYYYEPNRDYSSVELFMMNKNTHHYNSFIFGSCALGGINSYHWRSKLPDGAEQFVFQSWRETLTGIEDKIVWLHEHKIPIDNAIIVLDIPSTFNAEQLSSDAVVLHDPKMSRISPLRWHFDMYLNFLQKPSVWVTSIENWYIRKYIGGKPKLSFDIVSNDQFARDSTDFTRMPPKDSMRDATPRLLEVLSYRIEQRGVEDQAVSPPLINAEYERQLENIKKIFDGCGTDYRVLVKPGVFYTSSRINDDDLFLLKKIFGEEYVYDYSGDNEITKDLNHFYDTEHFGLSAGWLMVENMYSGGQKAINN